jgi:MFS transporter, ACS family, DAL5 transporter family protein
MADLEKNHDVSSSDPEKLADLTPNITYGEGQTKDTRFKHADPNDGDEALKAFAGHEGEVIELTPEAERKLLRKIDLNLMPVIPPHPSVPRSLLIDMNDRCSVSSTG